MTTSDAYAEAAVLAPVYRDEDGVLRVVLLLRTDVGVHGGQLGFPGGRPEPGDADLLATALREAQEEVGLRPEQADILAALTPLETRATGWRVYPFLARIPRDVDWRLQSDEVVRLLTPSVDHLADTGRRALLPFTSTAFPEPIEVEGIDVDGHVLWGMTLRLLDALVPRLLGREWDV